VAWTCNTLNNKKRATGEKETRNLHLAHDQREAYDFALCERKTPLSCQMCCPVLYFFTPVAPLMFANTFSNTFFLVAAHLRNCKEKNASAKMIFTSHRLLP
jgi:hypothetical protein